MTYIITGAYGSGKTEFAVNLAIHLSTLGRGRITIADMDVVNPFFRSREASKILAPLGVDVAGSVFENHIAQDIPAISYAFLSRIRAGEDVIIDLAGDTVGLNLLASCYAAIGSYQLLCVCNMYRPQTVTLAKMVEFCGSISTASKLPVTGLVNNGNLLALTTAQDVAAAHVAVQDAALILGVPLMYNLVQENIQRELQLPNTLTFNTPYMRKGWQG